MKKIIFLMAGLIILGCSTEDDGDTSPPVQPPTAKVPVAVDDEVTTSENTEVVISGMMDNDTVYEYARITTFDSETEQGGSVVDNRNNAYTYTPPENYVGEDSFEYTICDNAATPNCSTATVKITITEASPQAEDDFYETIEDNTLLITTYLANDLLVDNAAVTSLDLSGSVGIANLTSNGNINYQPASGFAGVDSFTYTICDDDESPTCSTATITVDVIDEGSPVANDDVVVVSSGSGETTISGLLKNDDVIDDAVITSIDGTSTQGTINIDNDGNITYSPAAGFLGEDVFTYSLCDDDTPVPSCSEATVTVKVVEAIAFNIPADLQEYYSNLTFTTDSETNFQVISDLTENAHITILSYGQRHDYLYDADEDLNNPDNVILMYTGESRYWREYQSGSNSYSPQTFNTEHVYPQSRLISSAAVTDLHHLRVADAVVNSRRLNHPFADGSGDARLITDSSWYPGDEWKGDVARMMMYLNIRYGETFTKVGDLELFLKWNIEDPVSPFEIQRNDVIETAQGNRNPFIDNPFLATLIWGGQDADNRWK